ncbi:hypothetical protein M2271_004068 [Streptomyces sp. LBL]|nr:hypothetical protein [Streptomyces sp. LBL]
MDYCSSCRRHLNGALVCPGCGAYAPDIDPATAAAANTRAAAALGATGGTAASESTAWHAWQHGRPGDETAVGVGVESAPSSDASGHFDGVSPLPEGRAARRRQRARWKKNQRRAVVATAVALVGGGVTLASMDRQSGDRTQAAAAPKGPDMGTLAEQTLQDGRPTSPQPDAHRSSPTAPVQSPAPDLPRQQYSTDSVRTTPSAQPDAAAPPRAGVRSTAQPQSTAPSSGATAPDRTDPAHTTVTQPTQTPAPAATGGTDNGNGNTNGNTNTNDSGSGSGKTGETGSGASQATPPSAATSPSEICLLVLCIG